MLGATRPGSLHEASCDDATKAPKSK